MSSLRQKSRLTLATFAFAVMVCGCAGKNVALPGATLNNGREVVRVERPARVGVWLDPNKAKPQMLSSLCGSKADYPVTVHHQGSVLPVEAVCSKGNQSVVLASKSVLAPGKYSIALDLPKEQLKAGEARYVALYETQDFASGTDSQPDHAVPIVINQEVKAQLNAQSGDAVDWYRFPGKRGFVVIETGFVGDASGMSAAAYLFENIPGKQKPVPRLLSAWTVGKRRVARLPHDGDYLLQIVGRPEVCQSDYTVKVIASTIMPAAKIPVIDVYRDPGNQMLAVLNTQSHSGFKVAQEMQLFHESGSGAGFAGSCQITSVSAGVAVCRVSDELDNADGGRLFARVALGGTP